MRCGVPLLSNRVAPRCTAADELMVVTMAGNRLVSHDRFPLRITGEFDLADAIRSHHIDTLICGGISRDAKDTVLSLDVEVVDNVACAADEIIPALEDSALMPGFGLLANPTLSLAAAPKKNPDADGGSLMEPRALAEDAITGIETMDCLLCRDRVCLSGQNCLAEPPGPDLGSHPEARRMIETAFDIGQEKERQLCRIAEMVYFCLEMEYRRIGVAFCIELLEPAQILTRVLRRFFEVTPVCCKAGGVSLNGTASADPGAGRPRAAAASVCNPLAQAEILNRRRTDFNLIVGLCVGADSIFAKASAAPVSTLFVKDRSLANNPIGALYSDYYLRESVSPGPGREFAAAGSARLRQPGGRREPF